MDAFVNRHPNQFKIPRFLAVSGRLVLSVGFETSSDPGLNRQRF